MKVCRKGLHQYEGRRCTECQKARKTVYMAERYAKNRAQMLKKCSEYQKANSARVNARNKAWRDANPEKIKNWVKPSLEAKRAQRARWRAANPEKAKAGILRWNANNKERVRANAAAATKRNPGRANAKQAKRRAAKLQATPSWANQFFVDEIYDLAQLRTKATGFKWVVDHEVPLRSDKVCGLHWEGNLQVISEKENIFKGNRFVVG